MKSVKLRALRLAEAADILAELINETDVALTDSERHIIDRHMITVNELRGVVKNLNDHGVIDEELLEGAPDTRQLIEVKFPKYPDGIPMHWSVPVN